MTTYIRCEQLWQMAIAFVATSSVIFSWNSAVAQIVPDNTLDTKVTPNVDINGLPSDRIDGGTTRGANLFHSFQEFSVREGRGAYFSNPAGIENMKLDGSLGGLFSPYDPVIRASGDVSFKSYEGASLHIFAGGSVTIDGTVTIKGADGDFGLSEETVTLSDRTQITIDGRSSPTLDIRAGTTAFGTAGIEGNLDQVSQLTGTSNRNEVVNLSRGDQPTSANIRIGSINIQSGGQGQVFLTNQYQPNTNLRGSIEITSGISAPDAPYLGFTSIAAYGNRY